MTYQNLGYWVGQSNDTSTGSHPTGWTNGQRWSETASEWQTMYSASASDATLWHGRADQAWGTSRVWSSGESWEAAYTRVLPAGSGSTARRYTAGFTSVTANNALIPFSATLAESNWGSGTTITCPQTGYYEVTFVFTTPSTGNQDDVFTFETNRNGAGQGQKRVRAIAGVGNSNSNSYVYVERGVVNQGTTYQIVVSCTDNGRATGTNGQAYITFIPTPTYPH